MTPEKYIEVYAPIVSASQLWLVTDEKEPEGPDPFDDLYKSGCPILPESDD